MLGARGIRGLLAPEGVDGPHVHPPLTARPARALVAGPLGGSLASIVMLLLLLALVPLVLNVFHPIYFFFVFAPPTLRYS